METGNMKREQTRLRLTANKIEQKLEEFWENDPGQVKQRYQKCTKALEDFNIDQYFLFRNHRVPPGDYHCYPMILNPSDVTTSDTCLRDRIP